MDRAHPFPGRMVGASLGTLTAGLLLQVACYGNGGHTSISDLPRVFLHRGVGPGALPYLQRVVEYPVGSGVLLYLAAMVTPSPFGVLALTGLVSIGLCVAITVVLERRCGARAWRWAIGAPVLLFAFQNWDVFAIAALLVGVLAFERNRDRLAGGALAVGGAIKIFPIFLLPPLVVRRWTQGDRRGAQRLALAGTVTFVAINAPFALGNRTGWWWTIAFQGRRGPTWGSAWFWLDRVVGIETVGPGAAHLANVVSMVVLVAGLTWLTVVGARRELPPVAIAAAGVAIFLLSNKVYSPTYDIWLVPFFVLLPLRRRLWIACCAIDVGVYVVVYGYLHGVTTKALAETLLPFLVLARTVVLLRVVTLATRPAAAPEAPPASLRVGGHEHREHGVGAGLDQAEPQPVGLGQ